MKLIFDYSTTDRRSTTGRTLCVDPYLSRATLYYAYVAIYTVLWRETYPYAYAASYYHTMLACHSSGLTICRNIKGSLHVRRAATHATSQSGHYFNR